MVKKHLLKTLAISSLAHALAWAQESPLVLRAPGCADVRAGRIVRPAVLVVENGRIAAVGPASPPPSGNRLSAAGVIAGRQ